jgi:hypothetical protein
LGGGIIIKKKKSDKNLMEKIDSLKMNLDRKVNNSSLVNESLLEISRELDVLIVKYYRNGKEKRVEHKYR